MMSSSSSSSSSDSESEHETSTTAHNQKQAQTLEPELALETDDNAGALKDKDDATTNHDQMKEKDTIDKATSAPIKKDVKSETATGTASNNNNNKTTKTSNSTNNSTKKKQKRKRGGISRDELEEQWKQERYDKLIYGARKDIYKRSKLVRTIYVQKCTRKNIDKTKEKQQDLADWKSLPLETLVVQEAVRRLGVTHLNPNYQKDHDQESSATPTTTTTTTTIVETAEQQALYNSKISLLLQHKKMEACLEDWNEKVTDFRRWCLRLSEKTEPGYKNKPTAEQGGKKKKKTKPNNPSESLVSASLDTSMFCSLGGDKDDGEDGDDDDEEEAEHKYSQYGPGAFAIEVPSKKNRMGQRARRAKHQAIQAKKDGKEYSSINWREKKPRDDGELGESGGFSNNSQSHQSHNHSGAASYSHSHSNNSNSNSNNATGAAAPKQQKNREEKDAASAHPSWAAKKAQKDTIVEFKGTKITF